MPVIRYTRECLDAAAGSWPASGAWAREVYARPRPPAEPTSRPRPEAIRLFENPFIETVLAKAHPLTPIVWFGPVIGYGAWRGAESLGLAATLGLFAAGWLVWTLLEYVMHRFFFHRRAADSAAELRSFMAHGYHHEFPGDRMRLVAPPLMSWPLAAVVTGAYVLALGADRGLALFAGTATGYVAYDWIHYYAHHFRPRNPVGRFLRRYHLLHHFDESWSTHRFGVSSPLWDLVFGTYKPIGAKRTRPASGPRRQRA